MTIGLKIKRIINKTILKTSKSVSHITKQNNVCITLRVELTII